MWTATQAQQGHLASLTRGVNGALTHDDVSRWPERLRRAPIGRPSAPRPKQTRLRVLLDVHDRKEAAPLPDVHRSVAGDDGARRPTRSTARRRTRALGRGEDTRGGSPAHPRSVLVLDWVGGGPEQRRACSEPVGRPPRRRPRRGRMRASRVDSSRREDEEDQAILLPHPAEPDGGRSDGKRRWPCG